MTFAISGGVVVDFADHTESQLDRVMRLIRNACRSLKDTLNQRGEP